MSVCLDEETIAAFVETRLPPDDIARLETHVGGCESCRDLVSLALAATPERTAVGDVGAGSPLPPAAVLSAPPAPGATLARGASVGRYTVLGLVGRGGMGEVYAAYDPELDRRIALKILSSDPSARDGRSASRLLREAKAIARLRHPHVVVVHDAGSIGDQVFIAMEYVDGQTLAAWLAEAPRSQREILSVFVAAGRGLQAAHAAGLVHRDFKPQNVMVGADGDVRVMDFGLARAVDAPLDPAAAPAPGGAAAVAPDPLAAAASQPTGRVDPALTRTGELLGTPLYMSAEQFGGKRTDARSDQFSFCVALYQALYGGHPFGGQQLVPLMAAVIEGRVQPAPPKSAVAPWLRRILLRGLLPDPDARYPSMTDLLAALDRDPAAGRRRWALAGVAALLVAGVAAGAHRAAVKRATCDGGAARVATAWGPAARAAIEKAFAATGSKQAALAFASTTALVDKYVAGWTGQFKESCEATHVRGEQSAEVLDLRMACLDERLGRVRALATTFATADAKMVGSAVVGASALPALEPCSDVAALRAIVRPPDDPATRRRVAEVREQLASVSTLSSLERCDQAMRLGRALLVTARQIGYLPLQAETSYEVGRQFDSCLDVKEAMGYLEDAVMAAEASHHDEVAIEAAAMLASAYADRTHDVRAARQWLRLAESILTRFPGHPLQEARIAASRGIVLFRGGRLEDALEQDRRALSLQEAVRGPINIDAAIFHNNVATVLHDLGRDGEAETSIERSVAITREILGDDSSRMALASVNQAEILTGLGKFGAAHQALDRAISIWRAQDASPFLIGYSLLDQGRLELAERQPAVAVATLERSVPLIEGTDPRFTAEARFALARALTARDGARSARALGLARTARKTLGDDPAAVRLARQIERWEREQAEP